MATQHYSRKAARWELDEYLKPSRARRSKRHKGREAHRRPVRKDARHSVDF